MNDEELKTHVKECVEELAKEFKEDQKQKIYAYDNHEADFHFDLHFLLNYKDLRFWKNKCVEATIPDEDKNRFDLIIYDPDASESEPKILIEIKTKYAREGLTKDFNKLANAVNKSEYDCVTGRFFLYFGDGDKKDLAKVKSALKQQIINYPEIACMLVHLAAPKLVLYNKDLLD